MFVIILLKDIKWDGLAEGSPFQRPKAAIVISIDSLPSGKLELPHSFQYKMLEVCLTLSACTSKFPLILDRMENTVCSFSCGYNSVVVYSMDFILFFVITVCNILADFLNLITYLL